MFYGNPADGVFCLFCFLLKVLVMEVFTVINDIETPSELVRFIQLPAKEEHHHTTRMILW